ncbi:plasmid pRiA4b ORF-3 family protein [Lentimicrobium sp. S6]|uniref:plasmid pRiA4b ORF-3 family protein n=1 Tax=Lentimicrobium sp. S6 TaxID=2735872 RepID=UPI0020A62C20|nr:plasmid pRiA4b ORF-3 family protein [Lentimicrobium sp. S6]
MAKRKKNKGKVIQMLSPENYIKQKARALPIQECWINSLWQDEGLAQTLVARIHSNGHFTVGMYLVDLKCLGIKDAMYFFNMDIREYQELLNEMKDNMPMELVEYKLVHNIVFAGEEYAQDLGFEPHKDFRIAEYILEEDTDDIELLDIECGRHGKPFYIRGPYETDLQVLQIIAQLTKSVGIGNFEIANSDFNDLNHDFEEDSDLDEERNPYSEKDIKESKTFQFKIQIKGITKPPVWRRIKIPSYYTFEDMHDIIQSAFAWESYHLYSFSPTGYGSYPVIQEIKEGIEDFSFFGFDDPIDAEETILAEIFVEEGQKYTYIYDFGDDWIHKITLEKIIEEASEKPVCLAGKGKCPPEDCGGIWGYEQLKETLSDKSHPEYEEYKEWLGLEDNEEWDAKEFNLKEVQEGFEELF